MNPPVQPPCANPPSRSSPACPGAWITPSSDTYSTTTKPLTELPSSLTALSRSADRGFSAWPDPLMPPATLKGFLANPTHRRAPVQREDPSHRNALLLCSQAANVDARLADARAGPASSTLARPGRGQPGRRPAEDRQIPPAQRCSSPAVRPQPDRSCSHVLAAQSGTRLPATSRELRTHRR